MSRSPLPSIGLGLCALLAVACRSPRPSQEAVEARALELLMQWFPDVDPPMNRGNLVAALTPAPAVVRPAGSPQAELARAAALEALAHADYGRARDHLFELLGTHELEDAAGVLDGGDARRALAMLDRCARNSPESPRLLSLRAHARWLVGREDGAAGKDLVRSALDDSLRAARGAGGPDDWTRASEAAFWLGEREPAREYAEQAVARGAALVHGGGAERALAVARVADLHALAASSPAPETLAEPARRTLGALEEYLGFAPDDLWAWHELTAILERHELAGRAHSATALALGFAPADPSLHERFARLSLALGGRERVLADYRTFAARHPEVALGHWYPAVQHFESGCELLNAGRDGRASFENAERLFGQARARDPEIESTCKEFEAWCRVGSGWSLSVTNELDAAELAFRSAEALVPGMLAREFAGRLSNGLAGLDQLGVAWERGSQDTSDPASRSKLEHAGELYEYLHAYAPENVHWAIRAGLLLRDTATALETRAELDCKRGAEAEAERGLARARELMERSWRAYRDALALAPDDVRLLNDTALILVYHLQREAELAEQDLRHALELGEAALPELARAAAEEGLEPELRRTRKRDHEAFVSAVADVCQNLGMLYLTLRGDAAQALGYLERCHDMDPRPELDGPDGYLEVCRRALADGQVARVNDERRWAAPCKLR